MLSLHYPKTLKGKKMTETLQNIKENFTFVKAQDKLYIGGTHKSGGYVSTQSYIENIRFQYNITTDINGMTQKEYIKNKLGLDIDTLELEEFVALNRGYNETDVIDTKLLNTLARLLPTNEIIASAKAEIENHAPKEDTLSWREFSNKKEEIQYKYLFEIQEIVKELI
jgi:hypothetical protein